MIANIEEMIKVGVNSFKVEGRMRSIYYIATVINIYRHLIDKVVNKTNPKTRTILLFPKDISSTLPSSVLEGFLVHATISSLAIHPA